MPPNAVWRAAFPIMLWLASCSGDFQTATPVPGDPLTGNGVVRRTANTYAGLMNSAQPTHLVRESDFGLPPGAASATQKFEGTLTLYPSAAGYFNVHHDQFNLTHGGRDISAYNRLPPFHYQFVQNGSYLIPVTQGWMVTGSSSWNYIIGPGRVWSEATDHGYMRAAIPFALVERNQNCVHNGTLTFLFDRNAAPAISNAAYQITGEGCPTFMIDMAGQVAAGYTPVKVANALALETEEAAEVANRMPVKPFSALAADFPASGIDIAAFLGQYAHPNNVTTYGVVINGINYNSGCATRHTASGLGTYPFCQEMRFPSYSTAKSAFSSLAMMRLGQLYGTALYGQMVKSYLPPYADAGRWDGVTFGNASDMATGNYLGTDEESDEDGPAMAAFLDAESFDAKIAAALTPFPRQAPPGKMFVYQSAASFVQTQGMNAFLKKQRGDDSDLFAMMSAELYQPLKTSKGFQSTLRTDNSAAGAPAGYYGLFYTIDDIAKIGRFIGAGTGVVDGVQVIDAERLRQALFRTADPGLPVPDSGAPAFANTYVYNHNFWGKKITPVEFPTIACSLTIPFMSGYGGITIMPLPNGATYYAISDAHEFPIDAAITQINKLAPYCSQGGKI